jgi:hypothetical protein
MPYGEHAAALTIHGILEITDGAGMAPTHRKVQLLPNLS